MSQNNGLTKKETPNRRYIGKVKNQQGQYGTFQTIFIDNSNTQNGDGTPNQFHKGHLLWLDEETGKKYVIKQFAIRGVGKKQLENGFCNSIAIDLDNSYHVQEIA